jgi:hypothetical protein
MRVRNKDCSPVGIYHCNTAPTPTGFAEIVSDDFPVLQRHLSENQAPSMQLDSNLNADGPPKCKSGTFNLSFAGASSTIAGIVLGFVLDCSCFQRIWRPDYSPICQQGISCCNFSTRDRFSIKKASPFQFLQTCAIFYVRAHSATLRRRLH